MELSEEPTSNYECWQRFVFNEIIEIPPYTHTLGYTRNFRTRTRTYIYPARQADTPLSKARAASAAIQ